MSLPPIIRNRDITIRGKTLCDVDKRAGEWVLRGYEIIREGKTRECGRAGYAYMTYWAVLRKKVST